MIHVHIQVGEAQVWASKLSFQFATPVPPQSFILISSPHTFDFIILHIDPCIRWWWWWWQHLILPGVIPSTSHHSYNLHNSSMLILMFTEGQLGHRLLKFCAQDQMTSKCLNQDVNPNSLIPVSLL